MVRLGVLAGLTVTDRDDYGEYAGEEVVTLAAERGLDMEHVNKYRAVMNHAAIADIITAAIRKPNEDPWQTKNNAKNQLCALHGTASARSEVLLQTLLGNDEKIQEGPSADGRSQKENERQIVSQGLRETREDQKTAVPELRSGQERSCISPGLQQTITGDLALREVPSGTTGQNCTCHSVDSSWSSSAFVDPTGRFLRRFIPVGNWTPERAQHEMRSWYGLGEVCMAKMPMQMVVAQLGPMNGGRRHNPWAKALLHPQHSSLRFRLRSRARVDGFKETWVPVYREEHDEIERERWLQAMIDDGVLQDLLFVVAIPLPGELEAERIRDMAKRKLDAALAVTKLPEKQLSTCDGPLAPCPFRDCCWGQPETGPNSQLFDAVSADGVPTLPTTDSSNPNGVAARFFAR